MDVEKAPKKGVTIVTSSISCLPRQLVKDYSVKVVPATLIIDGQAYQDGVDITPEKVYQLLAENKPFLTSAPSPAAYLKAFQEVTPKAESILCLTLSKRLSMMYDSAQTAAKQMLINDSIHVFDSGTAAGAQTLLDIAAARAATQGKGLEIIVTELEKLKPKIHMLALMGTMRYVYRTGRVPKALSRVGSFLEVKRIIAVAQGGIKLVSLVRTKENGVKRMLEIAYREAQGHPLHAMVMHANAPAEGEWLKHRVAAEFNCTELYLTDFSPVMGFATGPGTLVLSFYAE